MKTDTTAPATAPSDVPSFSEPYYFEITDDFMSPRYRQGDNVYVDPTLPTEVGKDVVLWNKQQCAIVGGLQMTTPEMWRIVQRAETIHEVTLELPVSEWPLCHRITGRRCA